MGQTQKWVFLEGRHTDCDYAHENMLSITHSYTTNKKQIQQSITSHRSGWPSQNTYKNICRCIGRQGLTSSTTWEALFQYKITMKVQEKVKKKEKRKWGKKKYCRLVAILATTTIKVVSTGT